MDVGPYKSGTRKGEGIQPLNFDDINKSLRFVVLLRLTIGCLIGMNR
jgi:hypothetical protein